MKYWKCLFRSLCVLLSICATIWPIYLYNLNEDALEIELKDLHSSNDALYPGIRLCFAHTILHGYETPSRSTLSTENSTQDGPDPANFKIDHYIRNIEIIHTNKTRPKFTRTGMKIQRFRSIQRKGNFTHIVLRRFQASDCLDIGVPFKENTGIHSISVEIEKDIFKQHTVPTRDEIMSGTAKVTIGMSSNGNIFHLPNQNGGDLLFNDQLTGSCSALFLDVKGMELFSRRKKPGVRCIGYDSRGMFKFLTRSTKRLGCMPDGLDLPINLPRCLGNKTNTAANKILAALEQFSTYPCRSIRDLKIEYNFDDLKNTCKISNETLQITAIFKKFMFKEIKVVRAYTIGSLVSSIGVIVGIFYGVSLIDVPEMVRKSRNKIDKIRASFNKTIPKRRKSQALVYQALGALRVEVEELNGRLKNVKRTLRHEVGELNGKVENLKHDIDLTNNQNLDAIRNEGREQIEGLRKALGKLNRKFQNAKKDIFLVNNKGMDTIRHVEQEPNEELQNARKDITLIRNTVVSRI